MEIPGLSMATTLANTSTMSDVGVALMAKSLDSVRETGAQMVEMIEKSAMELSVNPHVGGNFDAYV